MKDGRAGAEEPRRRTQAERSESMRLALFNATTGILLERGYSALRIADIAHVAGVSEGALLHHFETKHDMVVAAADFAFREQLDEELAIVAAASLSADPVEEMISAQGIFFFSPLFMVHTELMSAVRSEPAMGPQLRAVVQNYQNRRNKAWLDMLIERGVDGKFAAVALEMTLHLWRGIGLRYFRDPSRLPYLQQRTSELLRVWRTMINSIDPATKPASVSPRPNGSATVRRGARNLGGNNHGR
jgi:AcrR family transcriptional regulator